MVPFDQQYSLIAQLIDYAQSFAEAYAAKTGVARRLVTSIANLRETTLTMRQ
ncbi:hypothetical protein [Sphingomonas sp. Leaf242]|uniref:hypothetical protein n=1 Tax=Sphingomonas sp. Leaf242 TaxID=1736304 RepID=UPI000B178EE2|nr:hypothetical protein [Sphingomonas sp. Leaf242]